MKKHNSIWIIILSAIVIVASAVTINKVYPNLMIKHAIAHKYGWNASEVTVLEHQPAYFEHDFGFFGIDAADPPIWHNNEKWVCEYNGREFNVEYTNHQFADDYQLEDIFEWCTEYLQENVDPEIVGVEIFSDIIYHSSENKNFYNYSLPWNTKKVFTKSDAKALLKIQREYESVNGLGIFYKVDSLSDYGKLNELFLGGYEGDKRYTAFCKSKYLLLSKNRITKNGQIILTDKPVFSSNAYNISGVSYLSVYSLEKDGKAPYYVALRNNEQYYGG